MRANPLLAAGLAALLLAGCSGTPDTTPLDTVYTDLPEVGGNMTESAGARVIRGSHLEGRIGEGPWGATANLTVEAGHVDSPPMGEANALGGGGELTALAMPGNATATLTLRIAEGEQLAGYTARYYVLSGGLLGAEDANLTAAATQPAADEFRLELTKPGQVLVGVMLFASDSDTMPVAIYEQPFRGQLMVHWSATGAVQPQKPQDQTGTGAFPWPTPRDEMVDKFSLELAAGATVTATTAFDGTYAPGDGTDVDIGLYTPAGEGFVCAAGNLDPTSPIDPVQAAETFTAETEEAGTWTVEVGAMADGCGGAGAYSYSNSGPVPYTLDVLVG